MKYISTRDTAVSVSAAQAVIDGISRDGGLYVPAEFPKLDYHELADMDYASRVNAVLCKYFDFDISGVADAAYSVFETDDPAPTVKLDDNMFVLELWHGRTHAFKDMALSVLPRLLTAAKSAVGDRSETLILVATSGDTGKAALEGFKNVDGTKCCVFYPTDGVSRVQKLAMQTQDGNNVCVVGITGNFDDAQTAVKCAFRDAELNDKLRSRGIELSSANSINIGRLVPQIAYYYSAYCDLLDSGEIADGDKVDFVVPTGNFGNILAARYAMEMGLPIGKLICASNRNNVLTDFIRTGVYDVNREFYKTDSPSMDILVSSNLERLLFEISGRDAKLTAERMNELKNKGRYSVTDAELKTIREVFDCGYADDECTESAICDVFDEYGYLIDTHTAAAFHVANGRGFKRPTVVVSTANPYKFAPAVMRALGERAGDDATEEMFGKLYDITAMEAPASLAEVFKAKIKFDKTVSPDNIISFIGQQYGEA